MGVSGATGIQGPTGVTGVVGVTGPTGATGVVGVTGATGVEGATGVQGATGVVGVTGATGVQGITGVQGATGVQGDLGATGATGVQGITGATGVTGVIGVSGATGATGVIGVSGATGATGVIADGDKGDITVSGGGLAWAIDANVVTNAKLATVATARVKGRTTAGTGNVEDLTGTQATALLDLFTSSLKGLAPSSGGGTTNFLRADGTWAAPAGGGGGVSYGKMLAVQYGAATP